MPSQPGLRLRQLARPEAQTARQASGHRPHKIFSEYFRIFFSEYTFYLTTANYSSRKGYRFGVLSVYLSLFSYMGDLHLKIISDGRSATPLAKELIARVRSCFDAIEKRYLKSVCIWFHADRDKADDVLEAYVFNFEYSANQG